MSKLRNILLSGAMATTLTACGGGGGGGGAVGTVSNFIQNDVSTLSGSGTIVSSYSSLLSNFQNTIAGGDFGGLQAVITGPDTEDINTAKTLLNQLSQAETLWTNTENLISTQSDADKYKIYNSASYKEAYAAMVYLRDHVKPIITRVSEGKTITLEQLNKVAKEDKAQEIITQEKNGSATSYAEAKLVKASSEKTDGGVETYNQIESGEPTSSFSGEGTSDWAPIEGAGGKEKRTVKVSTPQKRIIKTQTCTWTEVVKYTSSGTETIKQNETCNTETQTIDLADKIEFVEQTREGDNPVVTTENLPSVVSDAVVEYNSSYGDNGTKTVPTEISRVANDVEVVAGAESTNTENYTKTRTEETGIKNQVYVIVDNWQKTTVTKPAVSTTSDTVTYKDVKTKQKRTYTITTERKKVTYKDGTTEIIETVQPKVYTDWTVVQISEEQRSVRENEVSTDIFLTPDITDTFISQASKTLKNNAYTDDDVDLGTRTTGLSTNPDDFKTSEFNKDTSKSIINADKAYARGWTGKGAVLGVIDSYQQTDHEALDGKYKWYNNYVRYEDGTTDENGNELGTVANGGKNISHGTHVAGIVAGKRDGNEFHGVAFDSELVGANIDYQGSGNAHMSYAAHAIQDIAKLKAPKSDGGEGMNIVAVNMSFNKTNPNFHYGTVTELSDGTYSAPKITNIMTHSGGGAQYWKAATDNDIVLVNSAGNGLYINGEMNYDYALDPGVWASETDSDGNLILGGKMIIVGNWGGSKADGQVVGSKAGHICLDIVDNKCNDKYKTSDFYILAPGNSVYSSVPGDGYSTMGGSSMAAPQVTGAMGILHQMWPHMSGDNLVKLVLNTADTNINGYDVNIHGQGMLDLDEATQPQGALGIPTSGRVDSTTIPASKTYFATGSASAFASLSSVKLMVLDEYDRDYYTDIGSTFIVQDKRKIADITQMMNGSMYMPLNQMFGSYSQGGQYDLGYMNFGLYTGDNGNGDYSANIGKQFFITDKFAVKTNVGQLSEQETWLGNSSDGALAVGDNNTTNFGQVGVSYQLGNNVLSFDYSQGSTDINTVDNSLITGFSDVRTESYKVSYEIHKNENDTLGWSFSLPSHITSGSMDMEVAESVNLDGSINYTNIKSDLTQTNKEKNFGFFYSHTPKDDMDANWNFTAEYRQDISGVAGNDGMQLGFNYVKKFSLACGMLWMKNPKCYNDDGSKKDVKAMFNTNSQNNNAAKHGLVYDMKTDKFVPIKK